MIWSFIMFFIFTPEFVLDSPNRKSALQFMLYNNKWTSFFSLVWEYKSITHFNICICNCVMHSKVQIGQVMGMGMPMSSLAGLKISSLFDNVRQIPKNIGLWCKIPTYLFYQCPDIFERVNAHSPYCPCPKIWKCAYLNLM